MGFTVGGGGMSLYPTVRSRNKAVTSDITVPGHAVEVPNGFGVGGEYWLAGETFPRLQVLPTALFRAGDGAAAPSVDLNYLPPPTGAAGGTTGAWAHKGNRLADLGWRNVKHYGAKGDGATDDRAAIQACVNDGSGTVYFPPGTYIINTALFIPGNIRLVGAGMHTTTLKAAASMPDTDTVLKGVGNADWHLASADPNVVMQDFCVDANAANRPDSGSSGLGHCIWFRGGNSAPSDNHIYTRLKLINAPAMALALQNCRYAHVEGCYVSDTGADGVSFWGVAEGHRVIGNTIRRNGDDSVAFNNQAQDASNNDIKSNQQENVVVGNVLGPGFMTAWSTQGGGNGVAVNGPQRITIAGNTIFGTIANGIRFTSWKTTPTTAIIDVNIVGNTIELIDIPGSTFNLGGSGPPGDHGNGIVISSGLVQGFGGTGSQYANIARITIANNNIFGCRGHGVWVYTSAEGGTIDHVKIANNTVDGNGGAGQDTNASGILIGGDSTGFAWNIPRANSYVAAVTQISDVEINGNKVSRYANHGIRCHGIIRPTVQNNQVISNGVGSTAPGIAILGCTDYIVTGNRSRGTAQTYGIALTGGAGANMVSDNKLDNNVTGAIQRNSLTGLNYIWHNLGDAGTQSATALVAV